MEAMACGLPVVCSKIRGNTDLVDNNGGILIKPTDVESYAGAILKLGNDKSLRETMGSYNQRIVEKFDVEKISSAMIMIYEDILKHNGR